MVTAGQSKTEIRVRGFKLCRQMLKSHFVVKRYIQCLDIMYVYVRVNNGVFE